MFASLVQRNIFNTDIVVMGDNYLKAMLPCYVSKIEKVLISFFINSFKYNQTQI